MSRPSERDAVEELVKSYLDRLEAAYEVQQQDERRPTLPTTTYGKVNVLAVARAVGLSDGQAQYFHRRESLKAMVNAVASRQGVLPIGAVKEKLAKRNQTVADRLILSKLAQARKAASSAAQVSVETISDREALLEQLRQAHAEIGELTAQLTRALARLEEHERAVFIGDLE